MSLAHESIAFVDVETTGGLAAVHRITEIAIVGMTRGEIEWQWSALVNPQMRIPASIEQLTGITNEMVAEAPEFASLAPQILERLQGRRFIAHNARFDYGFVRNEMRRLGRHFSAPVTCTVRLSRVLFPQAGRHSLDALIERHGLHCPRRHRALPDAAVLAEFWQTLLTEVAVPELDSAIERVSRRPSLPACLPADLADDLPECTGVYSFFGEGGDGAESLLYVGKANNLRERVLSHFGTALRTGKAQRLASQVTRIEWHETAGELGALLTEARWVREHQPVYNRKLRGGGERWSWWLPEPTATPRLVDTSARWPAEGDLFGLYRSAREARKALGALADEARLCRKLLGLEPAGVGSCFAHQIGRCLGACLGKEAPLRHGARVGLALARQKLRPWPWAGAIAVQETNGAGLSEWHVLLDWRHVTTLRAADDCALASASHMPDRIDIETLPFDSDIYRILTGMLGRARLKVIHWPAGDRARVEQTTEGGVS